MQNSTSLIISVFSTLGATLNTCKTIEECTGAEEAGDELASEVDRILITKKNEMGNATLAMVDKEFLDYLKQNKTTQDGCQSYVQQKPHDTGEDTKGLYRNYSYVQLNV